MIDQWLKKNCSSGMHIAEIYPFDSPKIGKDKRFQKSIFFCFVGLISGISLIWTNLDAASLKRSCSNFGEVRRKGLRDRDR